MNRYFRLLEGYHPPSRIVDHLGVQLDFAGQLTLVGEDEPSVQRLTQQYANDHLKWSNLLLERMMERAETDFYRGLARVIATSVYVIQRESVKPMTRRIYLMSVSFFLVCFGAQSSMAQDESPAASRSFEFHYGAMIEDAPVGVEVKVWIPIAESNNEQDVELKRLSVPGPIAFHRDATYQNRLAFFQYKASTEPVSFFVDYNVDRRESGLNSAARELTATERELFLRPNSLVPISGTPLRLLDKKTISSEPLAAGKFLYSLVEQHMNYDKSQPGYGKGDVVWACDSRTGNCTDFHSVFISLARSRSIPARFEIGFPIGPGDRDVVRGYHCWAWFYAEGSGWLPVDISEADKQPELKEYYFGHLSPDRVAFSTGRDIELIPESHANSLNYFVYPHVEVDGEVWPQEKIKLDFSYQNLDAQN